MGASLIVAMLLDLIQRETPDEAMNALASTFGWTEDEAVQEFHHLAHAIMDAPDCTAAMQLLVALSRLVNIQTKGTQVPSEIAHLDFDPDNLH